MSYDNTKAVIEALLFASDKPVSAEQIKTVLDNLDTSEVNRILQEMISDYEQNNRGIRIIQVAGGFQMVTPPALSAFLKKLYKQRNAEKVSRPGLETLAIIAYKQPITRQEIESIRNVNIDGVIKSLLDKDLVRVVGRKKAPGRPKVYGTTRQFLEYFGLKSLEELPKTEDLSALLTKKEDVDDSKKPAQTN